MQAEAQEHLSLPVHRLTLQQSEALAATRYCTSITVRMKSDEMDCVVKYVFQTAECKLHACYIMFKQKTDLGHI